MTSEKLTPPIQMTWYIYKGEDLEREKRIEFPFYRRLADNFSDSELKFVDNLNISDRESAPAYPGDGFTEPYCSFECDLTRCDRSVLKALTGVDGEIYHDINYTLTLTTVSAGFKFALELDGREMGSVEATFH